MASYRVGIIGCGRSKRPDGKVRRGMAYGHAKGYVSHDAAEIVALADIREQNARALAEEFELEASVYTDYRVMLTAEALDIVSICTWPALHCEMVLAAAEAGVKAIHCEKPMAPTWGESKRMAAACAAAGVQLTFNHQRRFGGAFRAAKKLLDEGAIGDLQRLEGQCSNLIDWGTHWFDMFFFYNDDRPAVWVLGQFDKRTDKSVFGLQLDDQGMSRFGFANGVQGYLETGAHAALSAQNRLIGESGVIEVGAPGNVAVRYRNEETTGWEVPDGAGGLHGTEAVTAAVHDGIDSLAAGREPELAARKALQATELIFATYESSRRRGRVDLPLEPDDSALLTMLEEGLVGPARD